MRILGIDPGSRKTGWAVVEKKGRSFKAIDSGLLRFDGEKEFLKRLGLIYQACLDLSQIYKPEYVALESLIYVKSVTSLSKLAQARGAMVAAFSKNHLGSIYEYSPNLVKSTISGHGHSSKESVEKALGFLLGSEIKNKNFESDDEADALAIALCHGILGGRVPKQKSSARSLGASLKHLVGERK